MVQIWFSQIFPSPGHPRHQYQFLRYKLELGLRPVFPRSKSWLQTFASAPQDYHLCSQPFFSHNWFYSGCNQVLWRTNSLDNSHVTSVIIITRLREDRAPNYARCSCFPGGFEAFPLFWVTYRDVVQNTPAGLNSLQQSSFQMYYVRQQSCQVDFILQLFGCHWWIFPVK